MELTDRKTARLFPLASNFFFTQVKNHFNSQCVVAPEKGTSISISTGDGG
jgi:hypothetical protein